VQQTSQAAQAAYLHDKCVAVAYLLRQPADGLPITHQQHLVRTEVNLRAAAAAQNTHAPLNAPEMPNHLVRTKADLGGSSRFNSEAAMSSTPLSAGATRKLECNVEQLLWHMRKPRWHQSNITCTGACSSLR
jgi:hypothetical protein